MPIRPYKEQPFDQEITTFFNHHHGLEVDGVSDVAVTADGTAYGTNRMGVARFEGQQWQVVRHPDALPGGNGGPMAADPDGALWVGCSNGVARLKDGRWRHWYGADAPTRRIHDLAPDGKGGVWLVMSHEGDLNSRDVWHFDGKQWRYWEVGPGPRIDPTSVALDGKGTPYIVLLGKVLRLRGKRWARVNLKAGREKAVTVAGAPDGTVWVGTTDGVIVLRDGAPERTIGKAEGLPVRGVHEIVFAPNGDVWFSHGGAASRMRGSQWRYYSPHTWFPGGSVTGIAVAPDGTVWMASEGGASRVQTKRMTLTEKSALFEARMATLHVRHGFVMDRVMTEADDPNASWQWFVTDNDGYRTADYCAAESFRYAVTKAEEARRNARLTLEAIMHLVRLPEKRGFLARSAYRKDDPQISAVAGEWHEASDGQWLWKGDTSSDELDVHMFTYSVYFDLVADEGERKEIAAMMSDLMGGVVDNDYVLLDVDGKHTRWGVWAPELLHSQAWAEQCKLNSMEILSCVRNAHHLTGEKKFEDAYRYLVEEHDYAETVRKEQLATHPLKFHKFDDALAFHAYYPLLKYETDPALRQIYLDSLDRFWQALRPERSPMITTLCNIFLERNEDLEVIFEALSGYRLDTAGRTVINSIRQDIEWRTEQGVRLMSKPLPSPERVHYDWPRNHYLPDRQGSPHRIHYANSFLLPYWMARYHGLLEPA